MSLHYLVKLEMLIRLTLPLSCYRKKLQTLFHLNQNLPVLKPVDYSVWRVLEEKVYKIYITDRNKLKQRLRTESAMLDHVVIVATIRQWHRR